MNDKFIKLVFTDPVYFFEFVTDKKPYDYQKKFLRCEDQKITVRAGRQCGKSTMITVKALFDALMNPNYLILIIGAYQKQANEDFYKIKEYINMAEFIKMQVERETLTQIEFKNKSRILCLPAGRAGASIRGYSPQQIIFDEAAFASDRVYEAIEPSIAVTKGGIILTSNTFGKSGFFYESFNDDSGFTKFHIKASDCPGFTKEDLERLKRTKPEIVFAQEYCYHKDTEYLTENSWKKFTEITPNEKIGCYNPKTNNLEYHIPTKRIANLSEKLITFNTKHKIVLAVTPEHTIRFKPHNGFRENPFKIKKAKDCPSLVLMEDTLKWKGKEINFISIPTIKNICLKCGYKWNKWIGIKNKRECNKCWSFDIVDIVEENRYNADNFLKFLGYVISEGCISKDGCKPANRTVSISQKLGTKAEIMKKDLEWFCKPYISKKGFYVWRKNDKNLIEWLRKNVGCGAINKKVPKQFLSLSKRQLKILFDAIMLGDGWKCGNGKVIGIISKQLANDMMEIGLKLGYKVYASKYKNLYKVSFRSNIPYRWLKKKVINYNDMTYCFSVPTGFLVTRYNGRVSLQGNSAEFIEEADNYFAMKLIKQCVHDEDEISGPEGNKEYIMGVDFARMGSDSSVYMIAEITEGKLIARKIISTMKKPATDAIGRIKDLHNVFKFKKIYVDESSLGGTIYDVLNEGDIPIIPCKFYSQEKSDLFKSLKLQMEQKKIMYPDNQQLITEMSNLKYSFTSQGLLKLEPPAKGHDDFVAALALVCKHFQTIKYEEGSDDFYMKSG